MLNLNELVTEMELKRARAHISFRKMSFNLSTNKSEYLKWVEGKESPNAEQAKLIILWISDQLALENPPAEEENKA